MDERMSDDKVEYFRRQLALERFKNERPYLFHNQRTLWLLDALDAERAYVKKLERMVDALCGACEREQSWPTTNTKVYWREWAEQQAEEG